MADFVLLYSGGAMPEGEEDTAKVMRAWTDWYGQIGGALKDAGNPFTPEARTISPDGAVKNGPVGTMATGYTIITAGSLDEATTLAKGCPVLGGGASITVYEAFPVM